MASTGVLTRVLGGDATLTASPILAGHWPCLHFSSGSLSVGPRMSMKYKNLRSFESEERSQGINNGPCPPQALLKRLCFGPCLLLLFLGFSLFLLVDIWIIGSKGANMRRDLETLRATFSNFTSNTEAQVQALHSQGGSLQATITSLKAVVENQEQELQAARSLNDKVFSLESKLEKEQKELQAGYSEMLLRVQQLVKDLHTLHCQVAALQSNDSQDACCPVAWLEHDGSCYWFSRARSTWSEAEKSCQLQNAHLVVINSREEQNFIAQHSAPFHTWIGLVEGGGSWKWVDGTDYRNSYKNWGAGQPNNWKGNEDDADEDCAEVREDGRWNDDDCQRVQQWACELKLKIPGQEP
ncbi:C-type lectin domain family 10 member A isoform X2 [Pipistrellus kuhlii]|uniref:C-type lectin domain family 10 member A isoform X2 n=2 Tax=Pipistrellus kuhlii TaxID=59472 RepID=UPI00174F1D3E|nr:C-type lectin domain family 10 member A isoform X2 [Pipistrellus kuhlii]XP_036308276.1 C-type lectin domain family 10 member A isoform X2 [Pipistrellus kuhlii]